MVTTFSCDTIMVCYSYNSKEETDTNLEVQPQWLQTCHAFYSRDRTSQCHRNQ